MLLKHHDHILRDALIQILQRNERVRTNYFPIIRHHCYTCMPLFTLVFIVLKRPVSPVVQTLAREIYVTNYYRHRKSTSQVVYCIRKNNRVIHIFSGFASVFISHSQLITVYKRLLRSSSETINLLVPILYQLGHRRGNTIYSCKGCSVRLENNG